MEIAVHGIDLGKTVRSLTGVDGTGAVVLRKRVQRFRRLEFLAQLPPCVVAMQASGAAHQLGPYCLQLGHKPRFMSPLDVRPCVEVHKYDHRDAESIAEAATRPTTRFVPIKSEVQRDLQALHRARERLVQGLIRLINQARGFLMERGVRPAQGAALFQKLLTRLAENHGGDHPRGLTSAGKADVRPQARVVHQRHCWIASPTTARSSKPAMSPGAQRTAPNSEQGEIRLQNMIFSVGSGPDLDTYRGANSGHR